MSIKAVVNLFYAFFALVFLLAGVTILLLHTGILPPNVREFVLEVAHRDLYAVHLIQEMGSLLVFVALITFWFIWHYEQSKPFHWAMTTFWALIALVHWFDVGRPRDSVRGQLVNTVPLLLFLFVGVLRSRAKGGTTHEARNKTR